MKVLRQGKHWNATQEEEEAYRRKLFIRAGKGDLKAKDELMQTYNVRVYSESERSQLPAYHDSRKKGTPPSFKSNSAKKAQSVVKKTAKITPKAKPRNAGKGETKRKRTR